MKLIIRKISPSHQKIEELIGREPPKTKKDVQYILGSLNQLSALNPTVKIRIPAMRKICGLNNKFEWKKL